MALAQPLYDYASAELKPFHLKASYQLFDEKGNPGEHGTFEYWQASPVVNRSTWARAGANRTDWHTADGKHAYLESGQRLKFFEYKIQSALLSPLPNPSDIDPGKVRLEQRSVKLSGGAEMPCIMVVPPMAKQVDLRTIQLGLLPTYCFDPNLQTALRISYSFGAVTTIFDKLAKVQGHYLARAVTMMEGKRNIVSVAVEDVTEIQPDDPALTPASDAKVSGLSHVNISAGVAVGLLEKKVTPVYPADAKPDRLQGTVVLEATIGTDGAIHDLRVVSAPAPSLAASSLWAVSQWQYRPYLLNGTPVEVHTTVNVIFSLGP